MTTTRLFTQIISLEATEEIMQKDLPSKISQQMVKKRHSHRADLGSRIKLPKRCCEYEDLFVFDDSDT